MLSIESCKQLVIHLEVSEDTIKSIWDDYKYHLDDYKFMMLWKWKESSSCSSLQDLLGAIKDIGEDDQKIYQVRGRILIWKMLSWLLHITYDF